MIMLASRPCWFLSRREVASLLDQANYQNRTVSDVFRSRSLRWRNWGRHWKEDWQDWMCLTTTDKINYPANATSVTITLNSLAASTTVGRQATVIDNTTNLYDAALCTVLITNGSSAPSSSKSATVYISGSDATNFDCDDALLGASDAAYTINSPSNLKIGEVLNMPTASKQYIRNFDVDLIHGGVVTPKWCPVVTQDTGQALAGSGNSMTYSGVYYTNG